MNFKGETWQAMKVTVDILSSKDLKGFQMKEKKRTQKKWHDSVWSIKFKRTMRRDLSAIYTKDFKHSPEYGKDSLRM